MNLTTSDLEQFRRWVLEPYAFLTEACYTRDEVKAGQAENIRLLPKKPHVEEFCKQWQEEKLLGTVKSRRMQFSWMSCALELWKCLFIRNVIVDVIAQGQTESEEFLARHVSMYERFPAYFHGKAGYDMQVWKGQGGNPKRIRFSNGSEITAFSSDPESIRGAGATIVRCEEIQVWKQPEKSWRAILPVIQGGGQIVVIGTPLANSFHEQLVKDRLPQKVGI